MLAEGVDFVDAVTVLVMSVIFQLSLLFSQDGGILNMVDGVSGHLLDGVVAVGELDLW